MRDRQRWPVLLPACRPAGVRLSDHISLGVIAKTFPPEQVRQILAETGKASERERDLPAQVMVYYAIALALYMSSSTREVLRCLLEGLRWLWGAEAVKVAGKSGISQARTRLGEAPLHQLYELGRSAAAPALRAWAKRRCTSSTNRWCGRSPPAPARGHGTGHGGWSAWMAPASMSPTAKRTAPPSGRQGRAAARVPFRNCASWPWWRTVRTCCSVPAWATSGMVRRRWPTMCWRRFSRACCAWPTGSSSAIRSGRRRQPPALICSGGASTICDCRARRCWPMAPT